MLLDTKNLIMWGDSHERLENLFDIGMIIIWLKMYQVRKTEILKRSNKHWPKMKTRKLISLFSRIILRTCRKWATETKLESENNNSQVDNYWCPHFELSVIFYFTELKQQQKKDTFLGINTFVAWTKLMFDKSSTDVKEDTLQID